MAYVPPQSPMMRDDWPTLKEMLDAGKRLVVFIDKGADERTVPYLLPQFSMVCTGFTFSRRSLSLLSCYTSLRCGKTHTIPMTLTSPAKSTALLVLSPLPSSST